MWGAKAGAVRLAFPGRRLLAGLLLAALALSCMPRAALAGTSYRVVFASNLQASTGGCNRDDAAGCDLDSVKFDSATHRSSELTRLTAHGDAAEMFPAVSPDGNWVAYDYSPNASRNQHELRLIHLASGTETSLLSGARFPEWIDASHLVASLASGASQDITVLELALAGDTASVRASEAICSRIRCPDTAKTEDAYPFPGGSRFAFQSIKSDRYAAWLDGSRALLLTAAGADSGGRQTLARLILGEFSSSWSTVSLTDLASAIETAQGKTGRDFCTASARALASTSTPTTTAASPLLGIMGASQSDLAMVESLGANTVEVPLPAINAALTSLLGAAASANLKLVLSVERSAIQTSAWKFDLAKLSALINGLKSGLADARVAALLLADDLCQVNSSAHTREWDVSASELATAISTIKGIVPTLAVAVSFNKSSCLDTFVAGATAGSNIADIALLNCFYYKWNTTPGLIDSYQYSAVAFKRFSPASRVLPRIGVIETVGESASSFPSADWLMARSQEFFAFGGAFDGVMCYGFRQQEATQVQNIVNVVADASYVGFFQSAFASAQAIYGTSPAVKSFIEYYEASLDHYFITADAGECAYLQSLFNPKAPGWKFETSAFSSTPALSGTCASGSVPVYRAYNNGYARGIDANHRITSSTTAYQQTLAAGWIGEGVVMCAP